MDPIFHDGIDVLDAPFNHFPFQRQTVIREKNVLPPVDIAG